MKQKKIDREKGSAIILAILVLAFFMALSMNMFFLAKKKSERAGVKASGIKVLSNIDGGASIGYYELSCASSLVTNGLLKKSADGVTKAAIAVTIPDIDAVNNINVFEGVVLEKYQQYFGGYTNDIAATGAVYNGDNSMWFAGDRANMKTGTTNIIELWEESPGARRSIGGFVLTEYTESEKQRNATYEKKLYIPKGNLKYTIQCKREVKYSKVDKKVEDIESDELLDITVVFEKN